MDQQPTEHDAAIWRDLAESYRAYIRARRAFHSEGVDRVALLRKALRGHDRTIAVDIASTMKPAELQQLFPALIFVSLHHGYAATIRQIIASLPREWVLAHIEAATEPYLREGTDNEYRRFLELYALLDPDLTLRLARRAAEHPDEHVREAGEEFLASS